jgi:predicted nuclease with TOPRIM domain
MPDIINKGKDFFDPNRIADSIRGYEKDKNRIKAEKNDVFKEILELQGQIMRANARITSLEASKLALEKNESKVEGMIEFLTDVYNNAKSENE